MYDGTEGYSTVVGSRRAVMLLIQNWLRLDSPGSLRLAPPELIQMDEVGEFAFRFREPDSPAVAVVRHPQRMGIQVASRLQAEVMVGHRERQVQPLPELLWEPGFRFQAAGVNRTAGNPFNPTELAHLVTSAPLLASHQKALGTRVAVLDTGLRGQGQMLDFLDSARLGVRTISADDEHGHGTAVAAVIEKVSGTRAIIHPLRVLNKNCDGHSYEVFAGLTYALWSGAFHLINASLSAPVSGYCETTLGVSMEYLLRYCRANAGRSMPMLIAAAGNDPSKNSDYPATLDGAIVALADDAQGSLAQYNSKAPQGAIIMRAYGASDTQPLGNLQSLTGINSKLWGTSFAAAAITGAHVP